MDIIERNAKCARQLLEAAAEIERLRGLVEEVVDASRYPSLRGALQATGWFGRAARTLSEQIRTEEER